MKLLIVEDDKATRETLEMLFQGTDCKATGSTIEAIGWLQGNRPDFILLDLFLNGDIGLSVIDEALKLYSPPPKIVVMSASNAAESLISSYKIARFVRKPFDIDDLEKDINLH